MKIIIDIKIFMNHKIKNLDLVLDLIFLEFIEERLIIILIL